MHEVKFLYRIDLSDIAIVTFREYQPPPFVLRLFYMFYNKFEHIYLYFYFSDNKRFILI